MARTVRVGVLASGRGSNFEALVRAQKAGRLGAEVVCLGSDVPAAPAVALARDYGLPTYVVEETAARGNLRPENEAAVTEFLRSQRVDLVCLAGFMRIVRGALLDAYPGAILNIHPSLLPSFPGLEAPRQALDHGVKVTGCTVHFVDAGIDSGPIVLQATVPVRRGDTAATLAARILEQEHDLYAHAVRLWSAGRLRVHDRHVDVAPDRDTRASQHKEATT